jgi:malate dehydrogenase
MSEQSINELFEQTRNAGALIVDLAGRASAYYGPSAVVAELTEAICRDTGRLMSVSHVLSGQFGITGAALSLPAIIGKNGIEKMIEPGLTQEQIDRLTTSAKIITQTLKEAD